MSKSKTLQELNLVDGFLFGATTENPEDAKYIAKLIIERATGNKVKGNHLEKMKCCTRLKFVWKVTLILCIMTV